ncbi:MAG: type II secretion system protein GspD [Phycisphaerae bacterium]
MYRSIAVTLGLALLVGCNESVVEYTKFGGWADKKPKRMVVSGNPNRDGSAYAASEQVLSEHDWKQLEKIAPRPIWERINELRTLMNADDGPKAGEEHGYGQVKQDLTPVDDVRTMKLADGRVRIFYTLKHYGGASVRATRDGGTDRMKIHLSAADIKPAVALVQEHLGNEGNVRALPSENTLVVTCAEEAKDQVLQVLAGIDSPAKQVEITARIFEVSHDFDFQYGARTILEHVGDTGEQSLTSTFNTKAFLDAVDAGGPGDYGFQGAVFSLMKTFEKAGVSLDASFEALASSGLVKVVASPRMTVRAGKTGYVLAGQELPIQSGKIANDKLVSQKVSYKPVGVQLYITPKNIGSNGVDLHVVTIVSAVSGFAPLPTMGGEEGSTSVINPILDVREAETEVGVDDGDTLVIGGLRMIRTVTREKKLPGLGDTKLLQWLFKNHRSQNKINDLYFFVTPKIVGRH